LTKTPKQMYRLSATFSQGRMLSAHAAKTALLCHGFTIR
jgi:hypothetical protein